MGFLEDDLSVILHGFYISNSKARHFGKHIFRGKKVKNFLPKYK